MGDGFAFAGVLGPIAGIKETVLNGDKSIIVVAALISQRWPRWENEEEWWWIITFLGSPRLGRKWF